MLDGYYNIVHKYLHIQEYFKQKSIEESIYNIRVCIEIFCFQIRFLANFTAVENHWWRLKSTAAVNRNRQRLTVTIAVAVDRRDA